MAARPLDVVFDELVQNQGRGAALRLKFVAHKDRTWFLAIVLHSFAKHAEGTKLTDLEQAIVSAFRKNGYTDQEIKAHGKLDRKLPQSLRSEMFSSRFAQLDVKQNYTMAELKRDVPEIIKSAHAIPSATAPEGGVQQAGAEQGGSPSTSAASARFTIKASKFTGRSRRHRRGGLGSGRGGGSRRHDPVAHRLHGG
ncbi:hypothetical protein GCM10009837_70330 [Streptomyces durmitorensis]|uniref:Uncharacterized protein n=1 Tax=Streptomyces durmitorensis TaxID=319947 RepID=A0ABY4Q5U3_9ACTN|nr:hypothetical protein [Streptomyces durmitorensis]UQT61091.1 hypothetical protein M4V62_41815 [Streptomyces durmitorensis]